jgi:hypothetical protein
MSRIDILITSVAALALACGPAEFPDPGTLSSGRVLGSVFTPVEETSEFGAPADCGGGAFVAKMLLGFHSHPNVCTELPDACHSKANATGVLVLLERIGSSARPAFGLGTYVVGTSSEAGGRLLVTAYAARTDASCGTTATSSATAGTVTIEAIDTALRGRLALTFPGGESFGGAFAAPLCPGPYDTCNGDACTGSPVCVP